MIVSDGEDFRRSSDSVIGPNTRLTDTDGGLRLPH